MTSDPHAVTATPLPADGHAEGPAATVPAVPELPDGPADIDPTVWGQIHDGLWADPHRVGDVYRLERHGVSDAKTIADQLGVKTSGFVSNMRGALALILEGKQPTNAGYAREAANAIQRLLAAPDLHEATRQHLRYLLGLAQAVTDSPQKGAVEEAQSAQETQAQEAADQPGVYVYALLHYLKWPYAPGDRPRTLLKVGMSLRDARQRAKTQWRDTALPEQPVLLRLYTPPVGWKGATVDEIERLFHRHLRAADHDKPAQLGGGTEYFLTTLRMLDSIADLLGLDIAEVNSEAVPGDLL